MGAYNFKLWIQARNQMVKASIFFMASWCSSSVLSAETYCLQYAINELFNALNESILNVIVSVP